jgi:hypothetical protein
MVGWGVSHVAFSQQITQLGYGVPRMGYTEQPCDRGFVFSYLKGGGMPALEIWLTTLLSEPRVQMNEAAIRVYLHAGEDFDHVLSTHGMEIPRPLDDHLRLLWAGNCPQRSFEVVDDSTVDIRLNVVVSDNV